MEYINSRTILGMLMAVLAPYSCFLNPKMETAIQSFSMDPGQMHNMLQLNFFLFIS